jgi:hypothetical protein
MRLTLSDVRQSRLPRTIGLCAGDLPQIAEAVNASQFRLIQAGGETGWWNGWTRVVFNVSVTNPYITLPRQFARIINLDVCRHPIRVNNEFFEMLPGGVGLAPDPAPPDWCGNMEGYERGTYPTMVDVNPTNQFLRAYCSDIRDYGKNLIVEALDQNSLGIYGTIGTQNINGFSMTLAAPFVDSTPYYPSVIGSIQKDVTYGDVTLKQVDLTSGVEVTLARFGPTEINPSYRRYYITRLPSGCCPPAASGTVQVTALCKLEYVPATRDTDQLIITNLEALIEECKALRFAEMESTEALTQAGIHHRAAIKLLQNELRHYEGEQQPAVNVQIFPAPLECAGIGSLT